MSTVDYGTGNPVSGSNPQVPFIISDQGLFRIRSGPSRYVVIVVPVWKISPNTEGLMQKLTEGPTDEIEAVIVLNNRQHGFLPLEPLLKYSRGNPVVYASNPQNTTVLMPDESGEMIEGKFENYQQLPEFLDFEEADFHFPDANCGFVYVNFFDPAVGQDSTVCLGYDIYLTPDALVEMHQPGTPLMIFGGIKDPDSVATLRHGFEAVHTDRQGNADFQIILLNWILGNPGDQIKAYLDNAGIGAQVVGDMDPKLG